MGRDYLQMGPLSEQGGESAWTMRQTTCLTQCRHFPHMSCRWLTLDTRTPSARSLSFARAARARVPVRDSLSADDYCKSLARCCLCSSNHTSGGGFYDSCHHFPKSLLIPPLLFLTLPIHLSRGSLVVMASFCVIVFVSLSVWPCHTSLSLCL